MMASAESPHRHGNNTDTNNNNNNLTIFSKTNDATMDDEEADTQIQKEEEEEENTCPLFMQGLPSNFGENKQLMAIASFLGDDVKEEKDVHHHAASSSSTSMTVSMEKELVEREIQAVNINRDGIHSSAMYPQHHHYQQNHEEARTSSPVQAMSIIPKTMFTRRTAMQSPIRRSSNRTAKTKSISKSALKRRRHPLYYRNFRLGTCEKKKVQVVPPTIHADRNRHSSTNETIQQPQQSSNSTATATISGSTINHTTAMLTPSSSTKSTTTPTPPPTSSSLGEAQLFLQMWKL